jgi:hypothetical protein
MGATKKPKPGANLASISTVIATCPVLPGESQTQYDQALSQTIQELNATTPLQVYLAEKIFDCLWWIRRYEGQKRASIVRQMADLLIEQGYAEDISEEKAEILEALHSNQADETLQAYMDHKGYSFETLQQEAFFKGRKWLGELDELIALKTKTLAGFQASYEVLTNRTIHRERLELQNALLRRDLQAIEYDDKPPEATGQ